MSEEKKFSPWEIKKIEFSNHILFESGLLRKVNIIMISNEENNNCYEWIIPKKQSEKFEIIGFSACLKSDSTPLLYDISTIRKENKEVELVKIFFPPVEKHQKVQISFEYFINDYMEAHNKRGFINRITEFFFRKYTFSWDYTAYQSPAAKCIFKFVFSKNMALVAEKTKGWEESIPVTYEVNDDKNVVYYNEKDVKKKDAYSGNLVYVEFYQSYFILLDALFAILLSVIFLIYQESNLYNLFVLFLIPLGVAIYLYLKTIFPNRNIAKKT